MNIYIDMHICVYLYIYIHIYIYVCVCVCVNICDSCSPGSSLTSQLAVCVVQLGGAEEEEVMLILEDTCPLRFGGANHTSCSFI